LPTATASSTPAAGSTLARGSVPAAGSTPPSLPPTPSPSGTPSPVPSQTCTPSGTPTASPGPPPPTFTPTAKPASVLPTPTPEDVAAQVAYRYLPLGTPQPELSQPCPGCPRAPGYVVGRVVDVGGNPLPGVRLVCYNSWHHYPVVGTKEGGEYDFPILQARAIWYVVVLDESDQPISPEAAVQFDPLEACWYRLDWQRID
jgi:hypothetical protein